MKHLFLALALIGWGGAAMADYLVSTRTLRARSILGPEDLALKAGEAPGVLQDPGEALGLETRVAIYAGRPIRPEHLREPAVVERNQILPLAFQNGVLTIVTEGRAMERASIGETIRIMNVSSKNTVFATISRDGTAYVLKE
ncbi:flagella basal body P-ring formation protein FlgA [Thioclava sp. SK-1]|uniref:flagellar basal body P-ring formation chaperone FlgA n=1 Tax=Thioclava sp. SK-1 TaxID=1889770 RepID=UPI0008243559|nr:flagellar basal body P-ring formation chaperone FlgA [Thioclava sp. SK-1]OCX65396.1 flagella basal body P-ring formation protein FlgA [Thioclava sp. SK-1]